MLLLYTPCYFNIVLTHPHVGRLWLCIDHSQHSFPSFLIKQRHDVSVKLTHRPSGRCSMFGCDSRQMCFTFGIKTSLIHQINWPGTGCSSFTSSYKALGEEHLMMVVSTPIHHLRLMAPLSKHLHPVRKHRYFFSFSTDIFKFLFSLINCLHVNQKQLPWYIWLHRMGEELTQYWHLLVGSWTSHPVDSIVVVYESVWTVVATLWLHLSHVHLLGVIGSTLESWATKPAWAHNAVKCSGSNVKIGRWKENVQGQMWTRSDVTSIITCVIMSGVTMACVASSYLLSEWTRRGVFTRTSADKPLTLHLRA